MKIAILDDYQNVALGLADWGSLDAEVEVVTSHLADADEVVRRLAGCQVVVAMRERTPFPADLLHRLVDLRLLVTTGPVNAAIDSSAARQRGIVVSATRGLRHPTSELTWALILAVARNVTVEDQAVRTGGWQRGVGMDLFGRNLGLLGLGRLGSAVAKVGQAFGMRTIGWSQNLTPERAAQHGVTAVSKDELFRTADVLSVHLVLSDRTRDLVGAEQLAAMSPRAILVNTSRGPIVNEAALVDALRNGRLAGAGLDVFDVEPLPVDHPLRSLPNTVLTPHVGYVTREQYEIFYRDAVEDIHVFLAGAPIRVID